MSADTNEQRADRARRALDGYPGDDDDPGMAAVDPVAAAAECDTCNGSGETGDNGPARAHCEACLGTGLDPTTRGGGAVTRFTITVPRVSNYEQPVSPDWNSALESRIRDTLGGFTRTHSFGSWRSPSGTVYTEPVSVYTVDLGLDRVADVIELAEFVKVSLDQKSVYITRQDITVEYI